MRTLWLVSGKTDMDHPSRDIEDRVPLWDLMQMFWMDTDPEIFFEHIARACATSKYSLADLEQIFWNEVRPAVSFNMAMMPAPEWAGFDRDWLTARVLKKHRYGRRLPWKRLDPYSTGWWQRLCREVERLRCASPAG